MSDAPVDPVSVMDKVLTTIQETNVEATIYLKNGIKLSGKIIEFDKGYIQLTCSGDPLGMVIDRTAMSSVKQSTPRDFSSGGTLNRKT